MGTVLTGLLAFVLIISAAIMAGLVLLVLLVRRRARQVYRDVTVPVVPGNVVPGQSAPGSAPRGSVVQGEIVEDAATPPGDAHNAGPQ